MSGIGEAIEREVGRWPGVETRPHRFGGVEFRVNGHEIGHLHGGRMADLPFPVKVREELVEAGKARLHHVLPQTGWVSYRIGGEEDVEGPWISSAEITSDLRHGREYRHERVYGE